MSEDDDWFERALRDIDEDSGAADDEERDGGNEAAGAEFGDDAADDDAADDGAVDDADEAAESAPEAGGDGERPIEQESDPFGGIRDGERDESRDGPESDSSGGEAFDGNRSDGDEADSDKLEGDEADSDKLEGDEADGDASENDGPESGDPFAGGESLGEDDPFGGSASDSPPEPTGSESGFGSGSFGDDDPLGGPTGGGSGAGGEVSGGSADPFGGYRGDAGSGTGDPSEMGFGEFAGESGGDPSPGFDVDPDEFESSIDRTDVGIEGLDEMILGGVPRRSLLSVIGGAGTGKTTFALQFLNEALETDRKGIYITLEQTRESILSTAEEKGWSFREHAEADRLAVVAIDPIEMANSLASIRNDLVRLIAEFDADRLVLDSVSLLEMMYDHPAKRRSEVFGFTRSLKEAGVTTLLTSEASEENPYASRHGIVEYLTDAVFVLQYIRGTDFRETRLAVEIQKIRDANHSRESKPYEITDTGISVYGQANIF